MVARPSCSGNPWLDNDAAERRDSHRDPLTSTAAPLPHSHTNDDVDVATGLDTSSQLHSRSSLDIVRMVAPALDEYLIKETRDAKTGRSQVTSLINLNRSQLYASYCK